MTIRSCNHSTGQEKGPQTLDDTQTIKQLGIKSYARGKRCLGEVHDVVEPVEEKQLGHQVLLNSKIFTIDKALKKQNDQRIAWSGIC